MRNATGAFEYRAGRRARWSNRRSFVNAILLITTVAYEIHAAAPISRSFINCLYNCAGKCMAAVKYSGRRATTNADNYRGRWISIDETPMIYRAV